jgi:ferredoxin
MQEIEKTLRSRCVELINNGTCDKVIAWGSGEFFYDNTPAVFACADCAGTLVYDCFCGANLSKYLIQYAKEGKTAVLLKPCDTLSFNQLVNEHRINRDNVYVIGVGCDGMVDIDKIRAMGIKGITAVKQDGENLVVSTLYGEKTVKKADCLLEKCVSCKSKKHFSYDELIPEADGEDVKENGRFDMVEKLEAMTPEERFAFWQEQLSKCIRCNACRNACPACTCRKCVFDNANSGVASKANADSFEEKMFHIIRAFHVAGRCADCGECSRVCPQNIPLHLLNRKFIKEINEFYGEYQAGEATDQRAPLVNFTLDDAEPTAVSDKGDN